MQNPDLTSHGTRAGMPHNTVCKPVVLAIHGSASSGRQWQGLADQLLGCADVIAPDLPGYGRASELAEDRLPYLERVIGGLPGQIHVVAHSFGGAIAMRLANAHASRIASVTLYDPITCVPQRGGHNHLPDALDSVWRRHAALPAPVMMQNFFDFWATGMRWADLSAQQQTRLTKHFPGLCRDMAEIISGHWTSPHHSYRGPVAIFCGQLSPSVTLAMANEIARTHTNASVCVLPGLGHFAPLTHPGAVNTHFLAALSRNGAGFNGAHALIAPKAA